MNAIEKIKLVKEHILHHPISFPGGYRHTLYLADGAPLCQACAFENWASIVSDTLHNPLADWGILGIAVYWEGPDEFCIHCGKAMPSEYGDPDAKG